MATLAEIADYVVKIRVYAATSEGGVIVVRDKKALTLPLDSDSSRERETLPDRRIVVVWRDEPDTGS